MLIKETSVNAFDDALKEFMMRTKPQLLNMLANMVNVAEAEEILQEAYLKIYLLVSKNPNKQNPLQQLLALQPMLIAMSKNMAISNLRHQKVVSSHIQNSVLMWVESDEAQALSSESTLVQESEREILLQAINQLPPICRQVFVQRKLHAKSHAEIAKMLGISNKTVENHLAKGLMLCRKYVAELNIVEKSQLKVNAR
ncbi:RNA polymerase sigma factor [Aliiglaciecola lipolytica]|uniref:RNA polymerase sigma-70 factor, ECF subfamily n=1 Tax=Aliiglaciecola lipolytica E3 TaxID=1127673 RepID=K6X3Y8_9ALTE|nr:RNA polymerase sigma factor [Aliiglaciecola lipolytica]GAC15324.1 RNA polymerase sigma-70 factor, ECF subfamily [Aliiglaciecola lipolytica E3]